MELSVNEIKEIVSASLDYTVINYTELPNGGVSLVFHTGETIKLVRHLTTPILIANLCNMYYEKGLNKGQKDIEMKIRNLLNGGK